MDSKHAVVTGASQGIGRAIAEKLLDEGFTVHACARTPQGLDEIAETWGQRYGEEKVFVHQADVSKKEDVDAFAQRVLKGADNSIAILVNNAGQFLQGDIATEPEGQLEKMIGVNLMSAYYLTRALLPQITARGSGHIFNICSIASLKAYPGGGAYSISKYALLGFSDNLREELKPRGVRVTAICPGATWSASWSGSGVARDRIMEANDVAKMLWSAYGLSAQATVETIVMRPQLGDL